eukprot:scaffold2129_cov107-Isochrysis_galbana.AAC.4
MGGWMDHGVQHSQRDFDSYARWALVGLLEDKVLKRNSPRKSKTQALMERCAESSVFGLQSSHGVRLSPVARHSDHPWVTGRGGAEHAPKGRGLAPPQQRALWLGRCRHGRRAGAEAQSAFLRRPSCWIALPSRYANQ